MLHVDGQLPPDVVTAAILDRVAASGILDRLVVVDPIVDEINAISTDSGRPVAERVEAVRQLVHARRGAP